MNFVNFKLKICDKFLTKSFALKLEIKDVGKLFNFFKPVFKELKQDEGEDHPLK